MHPGTGGEVRDVSDTDYSYLVMRRSGTTENVTNEQFKVKLSGVISPAELCSALTRTNKIYFKILVTIRNWTF